MTIDKNSFPAIRADVSINHHPDLVASKWSGLDVDGTTGQQALLAGIAATRAVYLGQSDALDARRSLADHVQGRPVITPSGPKVRHGFEREYAMGVERIKDRVLKGVDSFINQVGGAADLLTQKVASAMRDTKTPQPLQQEIRAHIRSLPENKRMSFIASQPLQTYAAVASAPPYLSGLPDKTMELVRTLAERRFAKVEVEQQTAVCEMFGHLLTVRGNFLAWAQGEIAEANTPAAHAVAKVKGLGK